MKKRVVDVTEYAGTIIRAMKQGILLTTAAENKINTMVIGWGALGTNWVKPTFVAFVRESRYTREMLEKNPEFTVNIPLSEVSPEVILTCGRKSGRNLDKLAEAGLTTVPADTVSVPAIREFPLTLECKVRYIQLQEADKLPEDIQKGFYPVDASCKADAHFTVYGEITAAYILEE